MVLNTYQNGGRRRAEMCKPILKNRKNQIRLDFMFHDNQVYLVNLLGILVWTFTKENKFLSEEYTLLTDGYEYI